MFVPHFLPHLNFHSPPAISSNRFAIQGCGWRFWRNDEAVPQKAALAKATAGVVEFCSQHMARMREFPIAPGKKLGAWVCLFAAVLLWSPLWAAAWQANAMDCCSGGMCPIHGHTNHAPQNNTPKQSTPCDQHPGLGLIQCTMSCCHAVMHSFVAAIVFVLPDSPVSSRLLLLPAPRIADSARAILPAVAPPDLPPRTLLS
jgi:hypothetical protein